MAQFGAAHTAFLAAPRQLGSVLPAPGQGDLLRTSGWERVEAGGAPPLRHGFFPRPGAVALLPRSELVTTSPTGEARGPGGSVCRREGSPASPGRSTGCSPLEGAPRRSPPPRWAPSCSRTWRPPQLGVSWETRSFRPLPCNDFSEAAGLKHSQCCLSRICRALEYGMRPQACCKSWWWWWRGCPGPQRGFWRLSAAVLCSPCPSAKNARK